MAGSTETVGKGSLARAGAVPKGLGSLARFGGIKNGPLAGAAVLAKDNPALPSMENGSRCTCGFLNNMAGAGRLANMVVSERKNRLPWD